jgi:hypothetical protein
MTIFFLLKNIENIANKSLIQKNEKIYLFQDNIKVLIDSDELRNIIDDKKNIWSFSIASYATDNLVVKAKSENLSLRFKIDSGYIILNYKHKYFGWIQLVSEREYIEFKNLINKYSEKGDDL